MKRVLFALLIVSALAINAQDKKEEPKFGIKFSGFVKSDAFYDTRQTINIREGHFLLYPDNILLDADQKDINEKSNFNMLSIQSRLKGSISGPDAFGAKTSGVIEADFFGNENASFSDVNGFRLRHAFVKMNWKSTEILAGQYWHPMFIAESFPAVISFNTGAPFQPFSRNPQIRVSKSFGGLKLIGCFYTQRDFTSIGPEYTYNATTKLYSSTAVASSKYMRNAGIPNAHFQIQFKADSAGIVAGVGADYKTLVPELYTVNNGGTKRYKSDQTITSLSAIGFVNVKMKPVTVKLTGIFAENAYDMVMIGGYGVKEVKDTATGAKEFTNLTTGSLWLDAHTNGKKIQFGLFGGFTKNMGSKDSIKGAIYARGSNIDYIYRAAPRIVFISGKLNIAIEGEYTFAMYGNKINGDGMGRVTNTQSVANIRGLLAFIYNF